MKKRSGEGACEVKLVSYILYKNSVVGVIERVEMTRSILPKQKGSSIDNPEHFQRFAFQYFREKLGRPFKRVILFI